MKVLTLAQKIFPAWMGLSAVLAGCNGLGEGVLPVSASIQPFGGTVGAATTKAFVCLNTGLSLLVDFSNGARGDFTSRATYSSSNPAVVRVSNLDIAVPEQTNTFYTRGTLVPVSAGTATITVSYLTFVRTIEVTVGALSNFRVSPASADLAAKSLLDLAVFAELDGVTTPLDSVVAWSFDTPDTTIATINSMTGTITGVAASPTVLAARPTILGCSSLNAAANVTVDTLQSLVVTKEFASGDLVVGTTERLTAIGTLVNGRTQDLSNQVIYTSTHPSDPPADPAITTKAMTFPFSGSLSDLTRATRAVTTPVQIGASFIYPTATAPAVAPPPVVAQTIDIMPVAAALDSISIKSASNTVVAGRSIQFNAVASYDGGARMQDITRHVGWISDNNALAIVRSSTTVIDGLAGLVTSAAAAGGKTVTLTAATTNAAAVAVTATATLTIN